MDEETMGEALGLEKDREKEIEALVLKIVNSSQAKDEIIRRIERQGLEKRELHYAFFIVGGIEIKMEELSSEEQSFFTEIVGMIVKRGSFAVPIDISAEIEEEKKRIKKMPEVLRKAYLEMISKDVRLILPDGRCKCDTCKKSSKCPLEEFMRFGYEEIRKLEDKKEKKKKKREKGYKVKIG